MKCDPDEEYPDDEDGDEQDSDEEQADEDDESDLRRRTFLERHDWIPWIAAAILVGGFLGWLEGR